ncbi:alcohol dehydrogenase [Paraburkholderia monticola]|uniref:Alcohol dehydrogenase n=1 Tax=Paraburkholderia monticola TaxID=1399968 RepID=A0A149PKK9_9BURK|nr:zinc-binding dehydrogenase [Paraburkholderia monticola]KXU85572.1 alcohol dehydrogenase [Paraburkholderia monticola]
MGDPTVLAAVAVAPGVTALRELPRPTLNSVSGLLEVEVTGVCGSDWGFYDQYVRARGPLVIGHETVGRIAEAGRDALAAWGVKEGDRLVLEEYIPCGHCEFCRAGEFRHCKMTEWRSGGLRYGATELNRAPGLWGGFAQYQYLHPNTVFHRVPDDLEGRYAALALPVANGIEWTRLQGNAGPGDIVVVQGPGQQGLACVIAARAAGVAMIIVTGLSNDNDRERLRFARMLGADHTIEIGKDDLLETLAEITNGRMADLVLECTGAEAAVNSAFQIVRKTGRVVLGGHLSKPMESFNLNQIVNKFLTVRGMRGHSYQSVELALGMIQRNEHNVREMSTKIFPLEATDAAIRAQASLGPEPVIHCCVDPWA